MFIESAAITEESLPTDHGVGLSYMYNDLLAMQTQLDINYAPKTVLTTDAENGFANAGHALTPDTGAFLAVFNRQGKCSAGRGASISKARFRHKDGANFAFADGHVLWLGKDSLVYFPSRESDSLTAIDPKTRQQIGPLPSKEMTFAGRSYAGTFHLR